MPVARVRPVPLVETAYCLAGDAVGDLVYVSGVPVGGVMQVAKADPNAAGKHPATGVIIQKLTSTTCILQCHCITPDLYGGLTIGKLYWLGPAGTPVLTPVAAAPQAIGVSISASAISLNFDEDVKPTTGGGGNPWVEDEFSPTNGQVTFILSQAPTDANSVVFLANGVAADDGVDYTRSGQTITWTDVWFVMDTSDKVLVRYQ